MLGKIRIQRIQKLHQKKFRLLEKRFIAEGTKTVLDLIRTNYPMECVIATSDWIKTHLKSPCYAEVIEAEQFELDKISCLHTSPEVLALCELPVLPASPIENTRLTLVVDAVRDPGNLGTIIRLADWFGVHQIFASDDTVEWTNPKCIQASMGSFVRLQPIYCSIDELESLCLKNHSYAADLEGDNLYKTVVKSQGILVVSSESHGLHPILQRSVKQKLTIPSAHKPGIGPDSLNVAIATGIFLAEFARQANS